MKSSNKAGGQVALPSGCLLYGQYTIESVIGNGGFGITYKAYDNKFKRVVAIKELFPNVAAVRDMKTQSLSVLPDKHTYFLHVKKRFLDEAKVLCEFQSSPDIVNVYHFFEANQTAYYVMEYLTGMDLKHYLKLYGKVNWMQMSVFMKQILNALGALHQKNLIHRDISPDNIFITNAGRAMLIDFGSVRSYSNTKGFTTFLKEAFAPAEQYRSDGNQGPWTDIYALSVTTYYALTGVLPPKAMDRVWKDAIVPIGTLCPELPAHVAAAIMKGAAVEIGKRFQNIQSYASALFPAVQSYAPAKERRLVGQQGHYKGRFFTLRPGVTLTMGRDARCQIPYAPNSAGVSRTHCTVVMDKQGKIFIRDEGSSYGTFINGRKIPQKQWIELKVGVYITFSTESFQIL